MNPRTLLRPDEIKRKLDECVIGQDEAKKTLSVAVYNHYKRLQLGNDAGSKVRPQKSNVILLGNTGCGKTLLVKTIAKLLDVPYYIQDTTKLTASGYVGSDVEDCLASLLRSCQYNIQKAQKGIIVLDEGDKIARKEAGTSITRDVSGECVQQSLLKIVEGDIVGVPPEGGRKHPEQSLIYIDTSNILFILAGAFEGLEGIVARRTGRGYKRIGFDQAESENSRNILADVTPKDLLDFGLIPELIGRFPIITYVEPLDKEALVRILTEPKDSITEQYSELLRSDGVELSFEPEALSMIADSALSLGSGARALRAVMEKVMRDILFDAPRLAAVNQTMALTLTQRDILPILKKEYGTAV